MHKLAKNPNKTEAGESSYGNCRVIDAARAPRLL